MSYNIAAIDIHKKVRMVVAAVAEEVADTTGAAVELEGRKFGTGARERNHLVSWLQQHQVREVVLESTGQYWKPVWLDLEPHLRSCLWRKRNPTARPKDASTISGMRNVWGGVGWPAN